MGSYIGLENCFVFYSVYSSLNMFFQYCLIADSDKPTKGHSNKNFKTLAPRHKPLGTTKMGGPIRVRIVIAVAKPCWVRRGNTDTRCGMGNAIIFT